MLLEQCLYVFLKFPFSSQNADKTLNQQIKQIDPWQVAAVQTWQDVRGDDAKSQLLFVPSEAPNIKSTSF